MKLSKQQCLLALVTLWTATSFAIPSAKLKHEDFCRSMESDFSKLCSGSPKGTCLLKNEDAIKKAMDLAETAPQLTAEDIEMQQQFLSKAKPTNEDFGFYALSTMADCWDQTLVQIWNAEFAVLNQHPQMRERALRIFKKNVSPGLPSSVSTPIIQKMRMIESAMASRFITVPEKAKKDLESVKKQILSRNELDDARIDKLVRSPDINLSKLSPEDRLKAFHQIQVDVEPVKLILKSKRDYIVSIYKWFGKWVAVYVK